MDPVDRDDSRVDEAWKAEALGGLSGGAQEEKKQDAAGGDSEATRRQETRERREERNEAGAKTARAAEEGAAQVTETTTAKTAENTPENAPFKNSVRGVKSKKIRKRSTMVTGPIAAIICVLFGGGAFLATSQVLMPFHMVEQLTELFDGSYASRNARLPRFLKTVMNMEHDDDVVDKYRGIFGDETSRFRKMSNRYKRKLATSGITVLERGADLPDGVTGVELDNNGKIKNTVLRWQGDGRDEIITADNWTEKYRGDPTFRSEYNKATRSFTGRIAAWIDVSVAKYLRSHGLTRNIWKDWQNSVLTTEDENMRFREVLLGRKQRGTLNVMGGAETEERRMQTSTGSNGQQTTQEVTETKRTSFDSSGETDTRVRSMITSVASSTTSVVCGAAAVSATVSAIKVGLAIDQARSYVAAVSESVSKAKQGKADGTPINEIGKAYSERSEDGKSALQSEGLMSVMSAGAYKPNQNDEIMKEMNLESTFKSVGGTLKATLGCAAAQTVTATISLALDILTLGTFSIGKAAIGMAAGVVAAGVVTTLVNEIVERTTTDFCTEKEGVYMGACTFIGRAYMSDNFRAGGGTVGTKEKYAEFYKAQQVAIMEEAEEVRATHSPFDMTTSHTFLGSLVSRSLPLMGGSNLLGTMGGVLTVFGISLNSLLPTASAVDETIAVDNLVGDCSNLATIGAVGGADCNALVMSDMATMDYDPEQNMINIAEIGKTANHRENFATDANGNIETVNGVEVINANSNLGK